MHVIHERGGRANYHLVAQRLAYDQRNPDGWFTVYVSDLDGGRVRPITADLDFWPRGQVRHVGLPTWSDDAEYLLVSVEEIDPSSPASVSSDVTHHLAMQPGRGVANSIALIRLRDLHWWWLWRYQDHGLGSMHCYLDATDQQLVFSRMTAYSGSFASWDVGHAYLDWHHGEPHLYQLRYFQPISGNPDQPPLAEVNSWAPRPERICVSGNPLQGQRQEHSDVFSCDLSGGQIERLTRSSGVGGEPGRYDEHLVYGPGGERYAYMGSAPWRGNAAAIELFVGLAGQVSDQQQVSHFNDPQSAMYVPPQGGATHITAARPTWASRDHLITTALDYPGNDPRHSGEGPIVLFEIP